MRAAGLDFQSLDALIGPRLSHIDVACPFCGPECRSPVNRTRKVLRIYRKDTDFLSYNCERCGPGWARHFDGHRTTSPVAAPLRPAPGFTDLQRTEYAIAKWMQAMHPADTPIVAHLACRGLDLPQEAAGEALRWNAHCPFGKGVQTGCMVALVRDIRTDSPVAIHRTSLAPDGRKATINGVSRLSLGPIGGGAVKLTPDADVSTCLGVGEGLETTLSLRLLRGCEALPIWSLLAANQLAAFPVLPGVEGLWIAVDHDAAGMAAAETLRQRWQAAGVEVTTARPRAAGADLNDAARLAYAR